MRSVDWERRRLGNTGLETTVIGIGGAWIGYVAPGEIDEVIGVETVLRGLESGMNLIDTSGQYLGGRSEQIIGLALREWFAAGNRREDLIVCTKTGSRVQPYDYTYDYTMKSVEISLEAMGLDFADILLIHDPAELAPVFTEDGALRALKKLKEERVIRAIGLGTRSHDHHRQCIFSGDFEVSLTFKDFNLLSDSALESVIIPGYERGVGIMNASIMVNGFLGGSDPNGATRDRAARHGRSPREDELVAGASRLWNWCRERDVDLGALNLQYCLKEMRIASTIIGFSRPERVDQNIESLAAPIDDEIWDELYRDFDLYNPDDAAS